MRKSIFTLIFNLILGIGIASSEEFSYGGIVYDTESYIQESCIVKRIASDDEGKDMKSVSLPSVVRYDDRLLKVVGIAPGAFFDTDLEYVSIPSSVLTIGEKAFSGCKSLVNVELSYGVERIGEYCFQDAESLLRIEIPSSVRVLEAGLFRGCTSLIQLSLPSSITGIPDFFFCDCINLREVEYNSSIRYVGKRAFDNCLSLPEFDFYSLRILGERAFSGCASLKEIILKPGPDEIPEGAFEHCTSAALVIVGRNVRQIGSSSFSECEGLRHLELGKSVGRIGENAFAGCKEIKEIYVSNPVPPAIEVTTFTIDNYRESLLFVNSDGVESFRQSPYWMNFKNVIGVDSFPLSVGSVEDSAELEVRRIDSENIYIRSEKEVMAVSASGVVLFSGRADNGVNIVVTGKTLPLIISDGKMTKKIF